MRERLWLNLYLADLTDPAAVTRIAVDHCLAPARAAAHPKPGSGPSAADFHKAWLIGSVDRIEHAYKHTTAHQRLIR